jgi:hypothetical protein
MSSLAAAVLARSCGKCSMPLIPGWNFATAVQILALRKGHHLARMFQRLLSQPSRLSNMFFRRGKPLMSLLMPIGS